MVGLVADIAFRCARLNPQLGMNAAKLTTGLVLIDEIDLHLHPEWQQRVLLDLRHAFPRLQFVVTTHSPQVLSSIQPQCIRVLDNGEVRNVAFSQGARSSQVLEDVLGVRARPPIPIVDKLRNYLDLVSQGKWDTVEALKLREELDAWGAGSEPELIRADTEIRLKSFLRGEHEGSG
jgi:predicted ATP-binding protein involved in virulence